MTQEIGKLRSKCNILSQRVILSKGVARVEVLRSGVSGAKPRSVSDEGIYEGYPIALVQRVTFATKAIKIPREIPLTVFAFLFCCSAKQKFDCVWVVTFSRYSLTISPHSAQDDAGNRPRVFGNLLCKSVAFSHRKNSRYSPKASSCSAQDDTPYFIQRVILSKGVARVELLRVEGFA